MKNKILLFILSTILPIMSVMSSTAYQNQLDRINAKYYSIFKYGYERSLSTEDYYTMAIGGVALVAYTYVLQYPEKGARLVDQMDQEKEEARKLMVEEDFIREWEDSDYGKIMMKIKKNYEFKFIKDEFETKDAYLARIKEPSKEEYIKQCITLFGQMEQTLKITVTPNKYNAESQIYTLDIEEKYQIGDKKISKEFDTQIKVAPDVARNIKEATHEFNNISNIKWSTVDDKDVYVTEAKVPLGTNDLFFTINKTFSNSKPMCFEFSKMRIDNPYLQNYTWKYTDANSLYNTYNSKLQKEVAKYNQRLKEYPYNINGKTIKLTLDIANRFNDEKLKQEYTQLVNSLETRYNESIKEIRTNLMNTDYNKFIVIYSQEHPEMAIQIDQWKELYKCQTYLSEKDYQLAFINGKKPAAKTCKEMYSYLFNDQEFDKWYATDQFLLEVSKRKDIYTKTQERIESLKKHGSNLSLAFKGIKGKSEFNATTAEIAFIERNNIKYLLPCYTKIINQYFQLDQKMQTEYDKNGYKFSSKNEFFEAYIDANYKKILKSK